MRRKLKPREMLTVYTVEVIAPNPHDELASDTDCQDLADSLLDGWGFPEGVEVHAMFVRRVFT